MSNLNNNTTQLEALLARVNALPEAGGADTSDATAIASEIFAGETAYTADGKVTGTFTIEEELNTQDDLIAQIQTLVATKANPEGGGSSCEIRTFTVTGDNNYPSESPTSNPFIVGMTWEEFVNSPLNFIRYNGLMPTQYSIYSEQIRIHTSTGSPEVVATNGEFSGAVKPSDIILPINYVAYIIGGGYD